MLQLRDTRLQKTAIRHCNNGHDQVDKYTAGNVHKVEKTIFLFTVAVSSMINDIL